MVESENKTYSKFKVEIGKKVDILLNAFFITNPIYPIFFKLYYHSRNKMIIISIHLTFFLCIFKRINCQLVNYDFNEYFLKKISNRNRTWGVKHTGYMVEIRKLTTRCGLTNARGLIPHSSSFDIFSSPCFIPRHISIRTTGTVAGERNQSGKLTLWYSLAALTANYVGCLPTN